MVSNRRWLVGFMVCTILAGPLWVDKAFAAFRGTTSTTGQWASATLYPNGNLSTWGQNSSGQLGVGTTVDSASPLHVGYATNWGRSAAGGAFACAVRTDGTLWCWGNNDSGQLGLGDTVNRASPVQVGSIAAWLQVTAGEKYTCATRTNFTLWCWGNNSSGQLGLGDTVNRTSPVQVGTATSWRAISAGASHTCAAQIGNALWCWGNNSSGQLGVGDTVNRKSPVQVGVIGPANSIASGGAHTCAVQTGKTLWCWGNNSSGQLGLGDTVNRSSPVQVAALNTWEESPGLGGAHSCAWQTGNTLWCWGDNSSGQLGLGDTVSRTKPVQVGTAATWRAVTAGSAHTCGRQVATATTLWCWGNNSFGQLGLGDHVNRKTPNQLTGLTSLAITTGPTAFMTLAVS